MEEARPIQAAVRNDSDEPAAATLKAIAVGGNQRMLHIAEQREGFGAVTGASESNGGSGGPDP